MTNPNIEHGQYISMDKIYTRPDGHVEVFRGIVEGHDTIIKIAANPQVVRSLAHEAQALQQLDGSNHAPSLYRFDKNPTSGKTYLAMEYIEGTHLDEILSLNTDWNCNPLPKDSAAELITEIAQVECDFLAHNVFYRDLNLSHVIARPDGSIAYIDFGAASTAPQLIDGQKVWTTIDDGRNGGTWEFMAPEEFTPNAPIDESVITYRLGVLYHLMLTGTLPVPRFNNIDDAQQWSQYPHVAIYNGLSDADKAFFTSALAPNKEKRIPTIHDFVQIVAADTHPAAFNTT